MIIYMIILAIAGLFLRPIYELISRIPVLGDFLVLGVGLGIGYMLCRLSGSEFGIWKMLFMACLFIGLVGGLGIIGFIIIMVIAFLW